MINIHFLVLLGFSMRQSIEGQEVVVGVGFEPTNARSGRIYSPHPLATWIPYQQKKGCIMIQRGKLARRYS